MSALDFEHVFIPGAENTPVLLLLHGTGGDEHDLIGMGQAVDPFATILSVRGKVLENGMPRFFRRLAEGVFDLADLKFRTDELADFIRDAKAHYHLENKPIIALGYSNGANIAASLFLQRSETLDGGLLLRAMVPFQPETLPNLMGKQILMLSGLMDSIIPVDNSKTLAGIFETAHAAITLNVKPVSHGLVQSDFADMKQWYAKIFLSNIL